MLCGVLLSKLRGAIGTLGFKPDDLDYLAFELDNLAYVSKSISSFGSSSSIALDSFVGSARSNGVEKRQPADAGDVAAAAGAGMDEDAAAGGADADNAAAAGGAAAPAAGVATATRSFGGLLARCREGDPEACATLSQFVGDGAGLRGWKGGTRGKHATKGHYTKGFIKGRGDSKKRKR